MAKKARPSKPQQVSGEIPVVGAREPCPCGSGRRYKACHGSSSDVANLRPFAGRPDEGDLVCLREIVPSATAPLRLADGTDREVTLATVLPLAWPAMTRADGSIVLALQTPQRSSDVSKDYAQALLAALEAEPGNGISDLGAPGPDTPSLQSLISADPIEVTVHDGFEWWVGEAAASPEVASSLERANADVVPTVRLTSVSSAYWCRIGARRHLRWAMTEAEEPLLDALARLEAAGQLTVGEGSKYVGAFRALGIVVPVWDLADDAEAASCEEPAALLRTRLDEALASTEPLGREERRVRQALASRQLTLR